MKRWNLLSVLLVAMIACGGGDEAEPPATEDGQPAAETQPPVEQPAAPVTQQPAAPARTMPRPTAVPMPAVDEPWLPTDTGTVSPGMTRDQVIAVWGAPVTERALGAWTYLYFRNGCEASCGTFDVVFLENGQVVNAIVRGRGHTYAGTSTSPAGSTAKANLSGGTGE